MASSSWLRHAGAAAVAACAVLLTVAADDFAKHGAAGHAPAAPARHATTERAVVSGDVRFEVLSPTLIRTEYARGGHFDDAATYNAIGRDAFPPAQFTQSTSGGWLTITTSRLRLRYRIGSGAFTAHNLLLDEDAGAQRVTAKPWAAPTVAPCAYGRTCEAEAGIRTGRADALSRHGDFAGSGYVYLHLGGADRVRVAGVPAAGRYAVQLRYTNTHADARTVAVHAASSTVLVHLPATSDASSWRTVAVPVHLAAGSHDVRVTCPHTVTCGVALDTIAVTRPSAPLLAPHAALGGYRHGYDHAGADPATTPGLLYQDGWYLLDDTASADYDPATDTVTPRSPNGYQDGYVFGYGHHYASALQDLATLTGPPELLPRWAYGVWYSEYYDRTAAQYEHTIVPHFRRDHVPLDVLVTDTDFKVPDTWNGWAVDPAKFPDPAAYFAWAHAHGLHTTFNIHPSIAGNDPQFAHAQHTAHGKLIADPFGCHHGAPAPHGCYVFDWADPDELAAYFRLHRQLEQAGLDFWWLDWDGDASRYAQPGVTPDAYINAEYAKETAPRTGRGFVLSRAFGSAQTAQYDGRAGLPTGPWADKRTTIFTTGDTDSNWTTLHDEVDATPAIAASTGLSAVSDDIGGFKTVGKRIPGAEPGTRKLADDLYARWVQFGTFQPIDRLHGNHSDRLPWQYGAAAKTSAERFLRLREQLVPYTYTLAQQGAATGLPIARPLYLQYPSAQQAYGLAGSEYLYGPDVLVAPVTTPGTSSRTRVWFPPGSSWTDWFTGTTYAGGSTHTISTTLATMPIFVRSGGIVATRTANVADDVQHRLGGVTLRVAEGAAGAVTLYEDDGAHATQSASTTIGFTRHGRTHTVSIGAAGRYPGQVAHRTWTVLLMAATRPARVEVDGARVPAHWSARTHTLRVVAASRSLHAATTIVVIES